MAIFSELGTGSGSILYLPPSLVSSVVSTRESTTREGWTLLTVETQANGDSRSTYERSPSLFGSLGSSCRYKTIFVLSWLLQSAQYKICVSLPYTISLHLSSSPSKPGRQSCRVACLLICVSGFYDTTVLYNTKILQC